MKTNCRFAMAVHVLALLAYRKGKPLCSELVADSVNTNPVVIRRLLRALQKAGLVQTRKGAGFGSRLNRPPERIDLAQVFRACECDLPFARPRRTPNEACIVGKGIGQALDGIFGSARRVVEQDLSRTTLAEVVALVKNAGAETTARQKRGIQGRRRENLHAAFLERRNGST